MMRVSQVHLSLHLFSLPESLETDRALGGDHREERATNENNLLSGSDVPCLVVDANPKAKDFAKTNLLILKSLE